MDEEKNSLVLGALFHDIGKIKQRAGLDEDRGKTHVEIGHEWLVSQYGEGVIASAARNHHGNEPETWMSNMSLLFYEADNCSASERKVKYDPARDKGKRWHREICLANVFCRIRNPHPEGKGERPPLTYIHLGRADAWNPPSGVEKKNDTHEYRAMWNGFSREFTALRRLNNHLNIDAICHLFEKYAGTVPSITLKVYSADDETEYAKHPDISLFDHCKLTASAALCMYDYFQAVEGERWKRQLLKEEITGDATWYPKSAFFLLVGGDVSGIQRFIYTISSKGALRSLKGRSFYLELLVEHTVDRLLEETGLSRCNVIFTGGGHFYLLAPNTPAVEKSLEKVRKEVNDFLFEQFNGSIEQFVESVPFCKSDFKDCTAAWRSLSAKLEEVKLRRWAGRLGSALAEPCMPDGSCLESNCAVCGREDRAVVPISKHDPEVLVCEPCKEQYVLGALLQRSTAEGGKAIIGRFENPPGDLESVRIGDHHYTISRVTPDDVQLGRFSSASAVYHLNGWELADFRHPRSRPLLAGVYLPEDPLCRDLDGMARHGLGIAQVAALRTDVDNLGRVFSTAIPEGERTLSRMASVSRNLSLFFKYHLDRVIAGKVGYPDRVKIPERQGERRVGVIYSGGDDFFMIGHWLDTTEAAFDVRRAFSEFTANDYVTLSAGVALGTPHDPVYRLAELSGNAERQAKERGKNSVTLFDRHTIDWNKAETVLARLRDLNAMLVQKGGRMELPEGGISRGGLYSLLGLCREHRRAGAWILPKLAWFFGRVRVAQEFSGPWTTLKDYIFSERIDWHCLEIAVLWTLMMVRKEGEK